VELLHIGVCGAVPNTPPEIPFFWSCANYTTTFVQAQRVVVEEVEGSHAIVDEDLRGEVETNHHYLGKLLPLSCFHQLCCGFTHRIEISFIYIYELVLLFIDAILT
jgi:hypothetical protein